MLFNKKTVRLHLKIWTIVQNLDIHAEQKYVQNLYMSV